MLLQRSRNPPKALFQPSLSSVPTYKPCKNLKPLTPSSLLTGASKGAWGGGSIASIVSPYNPESCITTNNHPRDSHFSTSKSFGSSNGCAVAAAAAVVLPVARRCCARKSPYLGPRIHGLHRSQCGCTGGLRIPPRVLLKSLLLIFSFSRLPEVSSRLHPFRLNKQIPTFHVC